MKWITAQRSIKRQRARTRFAWLPIDCDDGFTRWLCRVSVVEKLDDNWVDGGWGWITLSALPYDKKKGHTQ